MIALYRGFSPLSQVIRWQTDSDKSHAAWILRDGTVVESWAPYGVRHLAHPFEKHTRGTRIDIYSIDGISAHGSKRAERFLLDEVGSGYDFGGIWRFVIRRGGAHPTKWFCSELVAAAAIRAGLPLLNAPLAKIAPGHIGWSTRLSLVAGGVDETEWRRRVAREIFMKAEL